MANETTLTCTPTANRGWVVAFAGAGINLALGVLHAWSVISRDLPDTGGRSETAKALPYAMACLVFCLIPVCDATQTFTFAYYCSAGLFVAAALVTFLVKSPQYKPTVVSPAVAPV